MPQSLSISVKSEHHLSKCDFQLLVMLEYPLDIRGILIQKLNSGEDYFWVAPFMWDGNFQNSIDSKNEKTKVKYRLLAESDSNYDARTIPRAAGIAARQGQLSFAISLVEYFLDGRTHDSFLEARALSIIKDEKMKVKRLLNQSREWPKGIWNLQDTPAWIIPTFIRRFRKLVNNQAVSIISGGHILATGNWYWRFEKNSVSPIEVIKYQKVWKT